MNTHRLDQLADGIFAIIMTLLAFDIKLPAVQGAITDHTLLQSLSSLSETFVTFFVTFALLFTYWRAHHFLVSVYAQNTTPGLLNYNALFFLLITIIPFSSRFLSEYHYNRIPIIFYGMNVVLIGFTLFLMRKYIEKTPAISRIPVGHDEIVGGYVRILLPVFSAFAAILLSFWNTSLSILLFSFAIIFNLIPGTTKLLYKHHTPNNS